MSTTILVRAGRMSIYLRLFEIAILIDTRMRKRFNLRAQPPFEKTLETAVEPASLDRSPFPVYILYLLKGLRISYYVKQTEADGGCELLKHEEHME